MRLVGALPKGHVGPGAHWVAGGKAFGFEGIQVNNTIDKIVQSGGATLAYIHGTGTIDMAKRTKGKFPGSSLTGAMSLDMHSVMNVSAGRQDSFSGNIDYAVDMHVQFGKGGAPQSKHQTGKIALSMKLVK